MDHFFSFLAFPHMARPAYLIILVLAGAAVMVLRSAGRRRGPRL